jgi:nicotinamide-nucleotide amidase
VPDLVRDIELSQAFGQAMRTRGWTCATAESCSAGLVGHIITMMAGSSDYYLGGVIAYSNAAKQDLLNVDAETLASFGAVSRETASQMANGARVALNADIGISTTGIAGPGGATERKPVGLIYVAVATPDESHVCELRLQGNRLENIEQTASQALKLAIKMLTTTDGK